VSGGAIVALIVVAVWGLLFIQGLVGFARSNALAPRSRADLDVTAFMPARDEAEIIERSVAGLLAQSLPRSVVIDDRSSDGTTEKLDAITSPSLTVLKGRGPGDGECGKPAALRDAVASIAPTSEWLLFVDADVVLSEGAAGALVTAAEARQADLVTGFPRMRLDSPVEKIVLPSVGALIVAANPPERIEDPKDRRGFANGQLVLVRRAAYEAAGGHGSVVQEILEDVRLAERIKSGGGQLLVADVRHLAETRMYASWPELREGFSKNLFLLVGANPGRAFTWIAISLLLAWSPLTLPFLAGKLGLAAYAAILIMQASLRRLGGAPAVWSVFAPLGASATSYLLLRSMGLHRGKKAIPWKGRTYQQ